VQEWGAPDDLSEGVLYYSPVADGDPPAAGLFDTQAIRALAPGSLFSLAGRVAVVTGAAGGIGRWLAAGLGAAGAAVLVTDVDEGGLGEAAATLEAAGVSVASVVVDLADEDAPERIVAAAVAELGGLDVVVNNAAVNRRMPILEMDRDTWDWIFRIDLRLPYFLSQAAARRMIEQGRGGSIVSISSLNALYGLEQISVYGPAKAGLSQLTKVMALEWAEYGIRANAIAPGFMDTPLAAPVWADDDMCRWILNRVPVERPGLPQELVGACLLLASEAGSFLTGQTLHVDGGASAGGRWFHPDR
jgi:NAD(P)-dependent dehydrogenase (short-subunit alcohol dehydrogenase family)